MPETISEGCCINDFLDIFFEYTGNLRNCISFLVDGLMGCLEPEPMFEIDTLALWFLKFCSYTVKLYLWRHISLHLCLNTLQITKAFIFRYSEILCMEIYLNLASFQLAIFFRHFLFNSRQNFMFTSCIKRSFLFDAGEQRNFHVISSH